MVGAEAGQEWEEDEEGSVDIEAPLLRSKSTVAAQLPKETRQLRSPDSALKRLVAAAEAAEVVEGMGDSAHASETAAAQLPERASLRGLGASESRSEAGAARSGARSLDGQQQQQPLGQLGGAHMLAARELGGEGSDGSKGRSAARGWVRGSPVSGGGDDGSGHHLSRLAELQGPRLAGVCACMPAVHVCVCMRCTCVCVCVCLRCTCVRV